MTGNKNRAFENDEGEMTDQQRTANGDNHDGSNVSSFSRKIFPHGVHGPDLSKFTDKFHMFNFNEFATRKTIAQGMLDLALLTANAAQLKRILTIGPTHRFYHLLLSLISISICLQVVQAVLMCILAIVFDLSNVEQHRRTVIANNILLMTTICSVSVNIVISTFDIADIK